MHSIAFLQDNHNHPAYRGASLLAGGIGGTESSVIQLAEALAARGHTVYALNRLDLTAQERGVTWMPLRDMKALPPIDIAIGVNSTRIFSGLRARKKITWLHNPPTLRQQLKRRNLFALLRHRPHAVLLGEYHSGLLHSWLPYSDRSIIFHGVAENFFLREPEQRPRPPRAIFASQPKRDLAFATEAWAEIRARAPDAELHVFCPQAKEREAAQACGGKPGVIIRGSVSRAQLGEELRAARVMLIPGVADETFCLAAAEATAAGVPIVTRGAGALAERVQQGETGFISPAIDDFIRNAVRLLTEDDLWLKMHGACAAHPALASWNERAADWEALFKKLGVC
jgi:glycosyltransferase involved in cell wall biosynthesis